MAPTREKWVRRFVIPETTRHKKGFTIYKVTSVVFLKSSHEEISKVSVWKRYNDFKALHAELRVLCSRSQIKESFPSFPKPKFFGRFEAEVIEERRDCALKFLEFVGRHSYLYSNDIFIKFFETSHADYCINDCSQSLSSDTSAEDDRYGYLNSLPTNNIVSQGIFQPKSIQSTLTNSCSVLPASSPSDETKESQTRKSKELQSVQLNDVDEKIDNEKMSVIKNSGNSLLPKDGSDKITAKLENNELVCRKNNNCYKNAKHNIINEKDSIIVQTSNTDTNMDTATEDLNSSIMTHDGSDLPQSLQDSSQYILIAAAHMSAAFKHEDLTEYEEAFTQYKMGISSLRSGVESDSNGRRADIIRGKISKYLERAEKLYNRYLNCNISLLSKPMSELQHYKVLKIIESVMLVRDVRQNSLNVVKAIEKLSTNKEDISNYILRGQVPYMVHLHACVETETTVFLILQHLSRGKLWDFITTHYNSKDNKICDEIIEKNNFEKANKDDNIILRKNDIKHEIEGNEMCMEKLNFVSTNPKVQMKTLPGTVEEKYEKYSDVSTTQLLEKAQILLQSVNATIKESNTVANRLYESKHLTSDDNTTLLNLKNSVYQSTKWNEVAVDINEISLEIDDINKHTTIEKIPEKNVIISNCLSLTTNTRNTKNQSCTTSSSLSDSCKDLSFDEKESPNCSMNTLKTVETHFAIEPRDNSSETDRITNICKVSVKTYNKTEANDYSTSIDKQIEHTDIILLQVSRNNTDIEQELWTIPGKVIRLWAAEILLALEALHQQEVIVFDLKPDNILLDDNGHVKLTYVIPRHEIDLSKYKYPYSSPELCMFSPMIPVTPATDIWSFGIILYELIVGNKFTLKHPGIFQSHSIISIPNKLSESAKSLLLNILKYQPNERMTISEIKQHSFFKDINWTTLVNTL